MFSGPQIRFLSELTGLDSFKNIEAHIKNNKAQWTTFMSATDAENAVPVCWEKAKEGQSDAIQNDMRKLLLMKAFRPDRLIVTATQFVTSVFGREFVQIPGKFSLFPPKFGY